MQLAPLRSADSSTEALRSRDAVAGVQHLPALPTPVAINPAQSAAQPNLHRGLKRLNPQLNQQVATAQQTLTYLGEMSAQLQTFKGQLSREVSGGFVQEGALLNQQQQLQQLWQQRSPRSGGGLNTQLAYSGDALALQHFQIRGLDAVSLQSRAHETLTFSLGGLPRQTMVVQLEPDVSMVTMARRFDQSLAVAGIRVTANPYGELDFAVPQTHWAQLQEGLTVRGEGKRFPTGEFSRPQLAPAPAAMAPASWSVSTLADQRQTLSEVVKAIHRVNQVADKVQQVLADAGQGLDQQPVSADAAVVTAFTEGFDAQMRNPRYASLSVLASSLQNLPRYRIDNLLSLKPQA